MDSFTTERPAQSKMSAATGRGGLVPDVLVGAGISLIVIVGLIHLINSPGDLEEGAYTGVLYLANFVGTLASAVGIYWRKRWGWVLGFLVAGGAFAGYVISRTVGLPGLPVETEWLEPLGVLSGGRSPVRGSVPGYPRSSKRRDTSN
jgi:uncharacterized membrane protein YfcA